MQLDIPEGSFEAYSFDCDGTLADSMPLHYAAFQKSFADMGVDPRACLVFEDAGLGIEAAWAAGMQAVHVKTHPYKKLVLLGQL